MNQNCVADVAMFNQGLTSFGLLGGTTTVITVFVGLVWFSINDVIIRFYNSHVYTRIQRFEPPTSHQAPL